MAGFAKLSLLRTIMSSSKIHHRPTPEFPQESSKIKISSQSSHYNSTLNNPTKDHHLSSTQSMLVFDLEGALLKSSSLFPYFMLVAFEAGGILRAFILLLLYPLLCLVGKISEELELRIMVFVSFFWIRKDWFSVIGKAVLPKFFLQDVGCEGFDMVMNYGSKKKKIGVSKLPEVMVDRFLKDYIGVEGIVGRELVVVKGYCVGLMKEKEKDCLNDFFIKNKDKNGCQAVGITGSSSSKSFHGQVLRYCKEVYTVTEEDKRNWEILPRNRYLNPLIFHDGRLSFRPTPLATTAMFMWLPFGLLLSLVRIIIGIIFPFKISSPILALTGTRTVVSISKNHSESTTNKGEPTRVLYACNHKTLLDPIYIALATMKPVTAVTYSMSKFNEMISPIRTVRLTRDRERDRKQMRKILNEGAIVVCPEGTTCREPYLLRFSPLFAEITDDIVPVAIDVQVSMFYGSTATGLKCLDPVFHLMNPHPAYSIKILHKLTSSQTRLEGKTSIDVANYVRNEIARSLGFECTSLTRKNKYLILAGNEGVI